jgi:hypothetical protein
MAAMLTRSSSAAAAAAASRHPQCLQQFKEGLRSIFRQWTGLELAVFHQWGGPTSNERADSLVEEVLKMFEGPDKVYKDDISLILEDYMETQFNTILEDGSPDELGDLLVTMWRECGEGNFTIVTNALAREYVRHEVVRRSQGVEGGDAIDSDDEDGCGDDTEGIIAAELAAITEEGEGAMEMEDGDEEEEVPRVDPDGWETVARGKKTVSKKSGSSKKKPV